MKKVCGSSFRSPTQKLTSDMKFIDTLGAISTNHTAEYLALNCVSVNLDRHISYMHPKQSTAWSHCICTLKWPGNTGLDWKPHSSAWLLSLVFPVYLMVTVSWFYAKTALFFVFKTSFGKVARVVLYTMSIGNVTISYLDNNQFGYLVQIELITMLYLWSSRTVHWVFTTTRGYCDSWTLPTQDK